MFWKTPSLKQLLPPPVKADHGEYSMILSMHDTHARHTASLLQLSLRAVEQAAKCDLRDISARLKCPPDYPEIWPGEHYKLLAGLTVALQPTTVIEIGTATGLSALCIQKFLPQSAKIFTFDIVPWHRYPNSHLTQKDFESGSLIQHVANLSDPHQLAEHRMLLKQAELIFIDATHDGKLEKTLLDSFVRLGLRPKTYILFDDIRVWTMLRMWREIIYPKIDLTSFGHWSGTGLVEITPNINQKSDFD